MKNDDYKLIMDNSQYLPLRDVVFQTLRQAILRGDLEPGQRLMEIKLSNQLGVSRTPIREAIRMLELEGLVSNIPRKGAMVSDITEKDLNDVLEVRLGLEELAISFVCERITEEEEKQLEETSAEFARMVAQDADISALAQADVAFHDVIYQATKNPRLVQLLNNLREQMYRYRIEYLKDASRRKSLVDEHMQICAYIANRDIKGAQDTMSEHISRQQRTIVAMMHRENH